MGGVYLGHRFVRHERAQNARISQLIGITEYLEERINQTVDYYKYAVSYGDDTFNYLAIGNSITLITSWGRGICSTAPDNDYFGLVVRYCESKGKVVATRFNFSMWERMNDRKIALALLNPFLNEKLNLVTIQVGENTESLDTYQDDLVRLVSHIRNRAPRAKIVMIGDFWSNKRNDMRRKAALDSGSGFADLKDIIGNKNYQSRVGVACKLNGGETILVPEIAASHPGDEGMRYIADRIIERL